MESAATRRLGDIFVERGLITEDQLQEALEVQQDTGAKLGEILVERGFIDRMALAGVISEQWDSLGVTARGRKSSETQARAATT
jgi:MSHA biogenesis protein MshE